MDVTSQDPVDARHEILRATEFLVRMIPDLDRVRKHEGEWNHYGQKIANEAAEDLPKSQISLWDSTKRILLEVAEGTDPRYSDIRERINRSGPASQVPFSELSLWLAGELKISVTVTKRLVAAALIGVASARGDWKVLAS